VFTACGVKHRRCCQQVESSVFYTTSCKQSLVLLRMGEIIARNMLSWLKLLIKLSLLPLVGCLFYNISTLWCGCRPDRILLNIVAAKTWSLFRPSNTHKNQKYSFIFMFQKVYLYYFLGIIDDGQSLG